MAKPEPEELRERLDRDDDSEADLGYHGTSLEAVMELYETGRLPVDGTAGGDFFMVPAGYRSALNEAKGYAWASWTHAAARKFNIRIEDVGLVGTGAKSALTKVPKKDLEEFQLQCDSEGRRGVVISLYAEAVPPQLIRRIFQDNELFVSFSSGVPWEAVRMIRPVGYYEITFFRNLI